MPKILLRSLTIRRQENWEPHPGTYQGTIEVLSAKGMITVKLDEAVSRQILAMCASEISRVSKDFTDDISIEIMLEQARVLNLSDGTTV